MNHEDKTSYFFFLSIMSENEFTGGGQDTKTPEELLEENAALQEKLAELEAENKTLKVQKAKWRDKAKNDDNDNNNDDALPSQNVNLSLEEIVAISNAKIHTDDVPIIERASKVLGVSFIEAMNDPLVKQQIERAAEDRAAKQAANSGQPKGSTSEKTDEQLLEEVRQGKLPEPGTPEARQLFLARRGKG